MNPKDRKKITVIHKYASESFSEGDWFTLGQLSGKLDYIQNHPRLFRSLSFGDEDYDFCVAEIINKICEDNPEIIETIIDHFDIDLWYEQKDPKKFHKIFSSTYHSHPDFWIEGYLKAFVSHLAKSKEQITSLKIHLEKWGISSFVAHEDIEPSREWLMEIEKALLTMDVLIAVIEPKFCNSKWTDQEVGYALGRNIDIIPIRAGLDPYGFMGKFQGIQAKNKYPAQVTEEIIQTLIKKPKHRNTLINSISKSIRKQNSKEKIYKVNTLVSWGLLSHDQVVTLLESIALSEYEKKELENIIIKYRAFSKEKLQVPVETEVPF